MALIKQVTLLFALSLCCKVALVSGDTCDCGDYVSGWGSSATTSCTTSSTFMSCKYSKRDLGNLEPPLTSMTNLLGLELARQEINTLPSDALTNLVSLKVLENGLTAFPDDIISSLPGLTELWISEYPDVKGTSSWDSLCSLTDLESLYLEQSPLRSLPPCGAALTSLEELSLPSSKIMVLEESLLTSLTSLKKLNLWGNTLSSLSSIPMSITGLTNLEELDLGSCDLPQAPAILGALTNLTKLQLSSNKITKLPNSITRLTHLTELSLNSNSLTALPEGLGNMVDLESLHLRDGALTALPESLGSLSSLTGIEVGYNELTALPESIGNAVSLRSLSADGNKIESLPDGLYALGRQEKTIQLSLSKNPFCHPWNYFFPSDTSFYVECTYFEPEDTPQPTPYSDSSPAAIPSLFLAAVATLAALI